MPFIDALKDFDPQHPFDIPVTLPPALTAVASRAMAVLQGRTRRELEAGLAHLYRLNLAGRRPPAGAEPGAPFHLAGPLQHLETALAEEDTRTPDGFPNPRAADWYALFAIGLIGDLVTLHRDAPRYTAGALPQASHYPALTVELALQATEALVRAEALAERDQGDGVALRRRAQAAAKGKASQFSLVRSVCVERYDLRYQDVRSVREAATKIYRSLSPALKDAWPDGIEAEERINRIQRWIGEFKRGKSVLVPSQLRQPAKKASRRKKSMGRQAKP